MLLSLVFIAGGIALLIFGSDLLIRGAVTIARTAGLSPLVIGLTVVAFGTSAPEMAISTISALDGNADIAMGNVVGSNIFNVWMVLGLSASIIPLRVANQIIRFDTPVTIGVSILALLFALDLSIVRLESLALCTGIIAYVGFLIKNGRSGMAESGKPEKAEKVPGKNAALRTGIAALLFCAGLALLIAGSKIMVHGAVNIATALGVSELIIGLTIVAAGTSMPELATSVVAAIRGERDIAVGNAIGSNIFNLLAVLGLSGLVSPEPMTVAPNMLFTDIPVMIGVILLCLPVFAARHTLNRMWGVLFVLFYAAYTAYLILSNQDTPGLTLICRLGLFGAIGISIIGAAVYALAVRRKTHPLGTPY
ncbi:MAG: calcium/sodium antiporter [Treponema sp.]|jgi:cation:H+ antiporter|nr:calcium/sodium antiporter [Treponema sp.]